MASSATRDARGTPRRRDVVSSEFDMHLPWLCRWPPARRSARGEACLDSKRGRRISPPASAAGVCCSQGGRAAVAGSQPRRGRVVRIATEQKPIELILARNLLDSLSTPGCLIGVDGTLVYYNETVAKLGGIGFEETGPMPESEWGEMFAPQDAGGRRIPFDEHPLTVAVR